MADSLRRSRRVIRLNIDEEFTYEDSLNFLSQTRSIGEARHHRNTDRIIPVVLDHLSDREEPVNVTSRGWSGLHYLPFYLHEDITSTEYSNQEIIDGNRSLRPSHQNNSGRGFTADESPQAQCYDSSDSVNIRLSRSSSSRYDFLEGNSFLSVSPAMPLDMPTDGESADKVTEVSSMNHNFCRCKQGETCEICSSPKGTGLSATLHILMGKIDQLTSEVSDMNKDFSIQKKRLHDLEENRVSSCNESQVVASSVQPKPAKVTVAKAKSKEVRVQNEKERTLGVCLEQLSRGKVADTSQTEDTISDIFELDALDRVRTKKNVSVQSRKTPTRRSKVRYFSSEEESDVPFSSGTESSDRGGKHRRSKVKSGAKIKMRPVVRTELWPHTISNEEDGEETTSEDIGLSKFLSCFTHIMVKCGKVESAGRALLLHAVCMVFECLSWAEARTFHNLIMVKLEQDRINWQSDFKILANQYLDKKVRMSMRSKGASVGSSSGYKQHFSKSFGKGSGSSFGNSSSYGNSTGGKFNSNFSKSKSLYPLICRQWNYSTCSYGEKCKKFHVCWSCAEAGKLGEQHMASSHDNSSGRAKQSET